MVSPMHRLRSLASAPKFRCNLSTVLRRTPQGKAQSPQKTSLLGEGWLRERVIVHLFRSLGGYLMSLAQVGLDLW
jgi:hypothetical protein